MTSLHRPSLPGVPLGAQRLSRFGLLATRVALGRLRGGTRAALATPAAVELLAELKGVPQKIGQHLAMKDPRHLRAFAPLLADGRPLHDHLMRAVLDEQLGHRAAPLVLQRRLASGSIAQVYAAQHPHHPTPLAVKIVYPHLDRAIQADLDNLHRLASLLLAILPDWQRHAPQDLASYLAHLRLAILRETRLDLEAEALTRAHDLLLDLPCTCPLPLPDLSTPRVLTTPLLHGPPLLNALLDAHPHHARRAVQHLACAWLHLTFNGRLLLPDLHPGNLLAIGHPDPLDRLALLDLGQTLELDTPLLDALNTAIDAARAPANALADGLAEAWATLGVTPSDLQRLLPALPALNAILFEPFAARQPWDVRQHHLGPRLQRTLHDHRIPGGLTVPPPMLLWLRAFVGLFHACRAVDAHLPWADLLDQTRAS